MNHLREWQTSCVDEQLIDLNVTALNGSSPSEYLLYSDTLPRRNDGRISQAFLKQYEHTEQGGWWCSGIDVLTGEKDLWGCFKPNQPRLSSDRGKPIKYEHPPKTPTGIFALQVPVHLWRRIGQRFKVPIVSQDSDPCGAFPSVKFGDGFAARDFWQWMIEHPTVPLCITEGAKKAGALLTAGFAAIALPGINNGYRTPKDAQGNRIGKSRLIPQLQKLAMQGREIYIAFDQDSNPKTVQAVNVAIRQLGYLLSQAGCRVKVITWQPGWGKGVDDFIAYRGQEAFEEAFTQAIPLDIWKAQSLSHLTYTPDIQCHSRYLSEIAIPETAKLIGIKSPKGTGKTKVLEQIVQQAIARQQWVLVIGHRVRLVEELCQRFGLPYITQVNSNQPYQVFGYGLCIDSLHANSQAQFNAANWSDGIVIIDEVEQVLWHALNSDTCKNQRVAILKSLKTLMQNVLEGEGKVFVADADLSDVSLEYLISLSGIYLEPFIVQNDWKPSVKEAWTVNPYLETSPKRLIKDLVKHIRQGGKPFVCLSAQKLMSQWGTQTLESYLKKQFPDAKVLRIDSESLAEPSHPAHNCINHLNDVLKNYDIVLASPSIETGVSIDLKGHFTSVWCIAQGVQTATSVCQSLSRIRENIPRYLWVAAYGFNQVGNGSTSIPGLLTSGHRLTQLNIRLLQQSDLEALDDIDTGFQAESLLCWAKMAVRVNSSMINYREAILGILRAENHLIEVRIQDNNESREQNVKSQNQLTEVINEVRAQNYQAECEAIAAAIELTDSDYRHLKKCLFKTLSQRRALRKYDLQRRYCLPVTPQLVALDDGGWYQQLRLHYFLTIGRYYLADRDAMVARKLIEQGNGSLFLPDFNGSQLGAIIGTLEVLGIAVLILYPQRQLKNTDKDLQKIAEIAISNRSEIKMVMGIGIAQNASSITIIRRLLASIGYNLDCIGTQKVDKKSVKVYQVVMPQDERKDVFRQWIVRDEKYPGSSEPWFEEYRIPSANLAAEKIEHKHGIQLSLAL